MSFLKWNSSLVPSGVVVGRKVSVGTVSTSSPSNSQTSMPSACPAAIATPNAVMSGMVDLTVRVRIETQVQLIIYKSVIKRLGRNSATSDVKM